MRDADQERRNRREYEQWKGAKRKKREREDRYRNREYSRRDYQRDPFSRDPGPGMGFCEA